MITQILKIFLILWAVDFKFFSKGLVTYSKHYEELQSILDLDNFQASLPKKLSHTTIYSQQCFFPGEQKFLTEKPKSHSEISSQTLTNSRTKLQDASRNKRKRRKIIPILMNEGCRRHAKI